MNRCWPEGTLRAYLDRELPAGDLTAMAAHLDECGSCTERLRDLAARADRVSAMMAPLAEPTAPFGHGSKLVSNRAATKESAPRPARFRKSTRQPAVIVAGLVAAAAWAAFALLSPKPVHAPVRPGTPAPVVAAAPPAVELPAPPVPAPIQAQHRIPARPPRRTFVSPAPRVNTAGFVALDDDPIDAGVVMRVALAQGQMQADVIYSPDGRPRAFRLINVATGK